MTDIVIGLAANKKKKGNKTMELIYRTIDGKEFDNEADACYHENTIMDNVIMLNRNNEVVEATSNAFLVWLKDVNANLAFHAMAERQGDLDVSSITKGEDYGLYYWDEGLEEYRWIDTDMIDGLIKIKSIVEGRGDKFNV
jgi:hypothetical protein